MADTTIKVHVEADSTEFNKQLKNAVNDASADATRAIKEWKSAAAEGLSKAFGTIQKNNPFTQAKENLNELRSAYSAYTKWYKQNESELTSQERKTAMTKLKTAQVELENLRKQTKEKEEALKLEEKAEDLRQKNEARKMQRLSENFKNVDAFRTDGLSAGIKALWKSNSPYARAGKSYELNKEDFISSTANIKKIQDKMRLMEKENPAELLANDSEYAGLKKDLADEELKQKTAKSKMGKAAVAQTAMATAVNSVKKLGSVAKTVFKTMGIDLTNIMSGALEVIRKALSEEGIASYNTTTSLFTNAEARTQQMKYGLSSASNYALKQTMGMLNMRNDDDLMYMNQAQKEVFNNLMDKYKTWYENLESTGAMEKLQEAQLEFKMLKEELAYKLLNWFAEHKDEIFNALEVIMTVVEWIADAILNVLNFFGKGASSSASALASSDNSLTNNYSNKTVNVNVNTTNNANATLSNKGELDNFFEGAGANTVKGIAQALNSL